MSPINTALLSFGMSGQVFHTPFIHLHSGFQLVGAWERSKQVIQSKYEYAKSFATLEEVLADQKVELVVVNTPTFTHFEYAKKALEAGKHVIVEKAFVGSIQEAVVLADLAKEKGLMLSVFQNRRWDSDFKTVQAVLKGGDLGEIVEARIAFDRYTPQLSPKKHKEKPSPGAGIIKDLGAHVIDQALTLFGMPKAVFADIRITREHSEVDDYFNILLKYETCSVQVHGGYFFRETTPEFVLHGIKGSFLKSRADVQEDQLKSGMTPDANAYGLESESEMGLLHTERNGQVIKERVQTLAGNYMDYYEGIYQAIVNGKSIPVTAKQGLMVMQVIDAAFKSAEEGAVVYF